MQKGLVPHLWFNSEAKEATAFYANLFDDSHIESVVTIKDTPSGDCDVVSFKLSGQKFMAISGGPHFKLNPSISLFVSFTNEQEIDKAWNTLIEGGLALMPYSSYPWATKYGWLQDKYGVSWQLSFNNQTDATQKIIPMIMFTGNIAGKAKEAIEYYTNIFEDSKIDLQVPYEKADGDIEGYLKHGRFTINGYELMAMDSSIPHNFATNEAFSFIVLCDTQEEIDYLWDKLSAKPEAEACGWLKDKFGVSWQITPKSLGEMMTNGTPEQKTCVTQSFMKMKKLIIKDMEDAYNQIQSKSAN